MQEVSCWNVNIGVLRFVVGLVEGASISVFKTVTRRICGTLLRNRLRLRSNKALQLTANPLRGLSAAELGR
jgi:hypothetical protein